MALGGVLVLTKEEELGSRCSDVLASKGYACHRMMANDGFSTAALVEKLIRDELELVVCEFRMSPLTALNLLRDLRAASLSSRVAVATLAQNRDDDGRNEFLSEGGAAHVALQPGQLDLPEVIEDALRQVASYRRRKTLRRNEITDYLCSVNDEKLFRRFAVRLFHACNYREVRETHGPDEAGKDLVFYEQNRLGELEYVGVQVKVCDIHASVSRPGNVTTLWLQVVEALNCPARHNGRTNFLDKYVVMTSGQINNHAYAKMDGFLRSTQHTKRIYFWGREKIADVIVEHAPLFNYFPR